MNYCGFASQETETAIENYLFAALTKVNLIEDRKVLQITEFFVFVN